MNNDPPDFEALAKRLLGELLAGGEPTIEGLTKGIRIAWEMGHATGYAKGREDEKDWMSDQSR